MPFVCHTTMQQHFIDISINITTITESESTTGKNYPTVDTLLLTLGKNFLRGGRVGKLLHCPARKEKLNHVTEGETDIPTCTQLPHSVWENFVSCFFCMLSRQENMSSKTGV